MFLQNSLFPPPPMPDLEGLNMPYWTSDKSRLGFRMCSEEQVTSWEMHSDTCLPEPSKGIVGDSWVPSLPNIRAKR